MPFHSSRGKAEGLKGLGGEVGRSSCGPHVERQKCWGAPAVMPRGMTRIILYFP